MARLQVYIAEHCWTCRETTLIVAEVAAAYPDVTCQVLDLATVEQPENVFAVPTYVLNGRVIFMGNPTPEQLSRRLEEL